MAQTAAKPALAERRQAGDRRRRGGRRSNDEHLDPQEQRVSEEIVVIAASIILAPRLAALELRDSMPMRNLIQQSVSLAKIVLQKARVELARDLSEPSSS
jgi:hypothetical protein